MVPTYSDSRAVAIGDGFSGEGTTRHVWDEDVRRVVHRIKQRYPLVTTNTYDCHPFCGPAGNRQGWARRSIDVWDSAGRGDPLPHDLARHIAKFLMHMPGEPYIRHLIVEHDMWLRGAGWLTWPRNDHTGPLRHVHVTYWPVPAIG